MPSIRQNLTTRNRWSGGNSKQWIVIHNVGTAPHAAGAAYNNTVYFKSAYRGASAHYFVDDGDVIWQCVADDDRAWSVGDSSSRNGCTNNNSINIEVCGNSQFTQREIENLRWLVQGLMSRYGIPASRVCRHYDVTRKSCPAYYVNESSWASLKSYVTGSSASAPSSGSPSSSSGNIAVDGLWGEATTRLGQQQGGTVVDGKVDGQDAGWRGSLKGCTTGWRWCSGKAVTGSPHIRRVQTALRDKWHQDPGSIDGIFGKKSWQAMERAAGYNADNGFDSPSNTIKWYQRQLNAGTFF